MIFFVFNIQKIISIKTGWAVKRNIEEYNQKTIKKEHRQSRENNLQRTDLSDKAGGDSRTSATVKLEQEIKETVPLHDVYFGSYPQKEILGEEITDELRNAVYDINGDAVINGKKYRRLSWEMMTTRKL